MRLVLDEFGAQPQARDRRPQIMADRREHFCAILDQIDDPCAHTIECARREADFARTPFGQRVGRLTETWSQPSPDDATTEINF